MERKRPSPAVFTSRKLIAWFLLATSVIVNTGCGLLGFGKDKPEPAEEPLSSIPFESQVIITADPDLNRDVEGRPSPVRVRVFLNGDEIDLASMSFEALFEFDGGSLSKKPVATLVAKPAKMAVVPIRGMRSESILTVAAAFRDPFSVQWLDSKTIDTVGDNTIKVTLDANGITID